MNRIIAWFADNHVAANLLMLLIIVLGVGMVLTNKAEVMPETSANEIIIDTVYSGASPAEVEEAIIRKIEARISALAGIKKITAEAWQGDGQVTIEALPGWDIQSLLDEVKAEMDGMTTLPDEAEKPVVRQKVHRHEVIDVAVFGDASEATLKHITAKIKNDLTQLPAITLAETFAVRDSEIHIEIAERTLRQYGLTLEHIAQAVRSASLDLPAGSVKTATGEIMIRTKGRRYQAEDYADVVIVSRPDGSKVLLGQIADITAGFEDDTAFLRFIGKAGAGIKVYRVGDQNALDVAAQVKSYMQRIRPTLPRGVEVAYFFDESRPLKRRITLLLKNMGIGLILVAVLLGLTLNRKLAFWVTFGIPVSFCFCTALMKFFDVSVNMVSLAAFITVLGIVVDDAIIIGENIFKKQEQGLAPLAAAVEGAREVGVPVIFSVLTTIVAFAPFLYGDSHLGQVLRQVPIVVILVLIGSLLESLLILPCHLAGTRRVSAGTAGRIEAKKSSRWLKSFVAGPYSRLLRFCLRWRYATMAAGIGLVLIVAGTFSGGLVKFTLFPDVEGDLMSCSVTMPPGTPVERTIEVVDRLEASAEQALEELSKGRDKGAPPLFRLRASQIGADKSGRGDHLGQVWIELTDGKYRNISMDAMTRAWREKMGDVPDAESIIFEGDSFSPGNAFEVHLSMDDTGQLTRAAEELQSALRQYPGVVDVTDSYEQGKDEMQFKLKPAALTLGITLDELARQVRHAFYGAEALKLLRDKDEVRVIVRYPEKERSALGFVEDMRIRTSEGIEVPFGRVAEVNMVQGYATIHRSQRRSVIKVLANVDESIANAKEIRTDVMNRYMPRLTSTYPGLDYTVEGEGKEEEESMTDVYLGFGVALFCIYSLLAIAFKSFTQPLIIMSVIPFGLAGAVLGHLIMGCNISLVSLVGMVGLTGVVVNDSLVLVHAANQLARKGQSMQRTIIQAGAMRFRAILLTSLTTFAGLTPMLMERSPQAKFLIPMAISLGFGVLFATGVTLVLVPCVYLIHVDFKRIWVTRFYPRICGATP